MTKVETGYTAEPHQHLEEGARHLDAPLLKLDLLAEVAALRRVGMGTSGHVAKTLEKQVDLRLVLVAFASGGRLDWHHAAGPVHVHVLDGRVAVRLEDQLVELRAGGLLAIAPAIGHAVEALAESSVLLTILQRSKA